MEIKQYVTEQTEEFNALLKRLAEIPSWTGGERARAEFCLEWLKAAGYDDAYIDAAGSVICGYDIRKGNNNSVIMAHLDTVFSAETDFTVTERNGKLFCPGIGDNTVNAVGAMLLAEYVKKYAPAVNMGIYFVLSTGEEGLGNLIGSRTFTEAYRDRISSFTALDLYYDRVFTSCVGSIRYRITAKTLGGHSYLDFGRKNAIAILAELISRAYDGRFNMPHLTYNVGSIEGGQSVNSIAANASMLFEFRSDDSGAMNSASKLFAELAETLNDNETTVTVDVIGLRPCGEKVDPAGLERLYKCAFNAITGSGLPEPKAAAASTDCNIPLSYSIPSTCFGVCSGGGAHTPGEWIDKDSNIRGMEVLLRYFYAYFVEE